MHMHDCIAIHCDRGTRQWGPACVSGAALLGTSSYPQLGAHFLRRTVELQRIFDSLDTSGGMSLPAGSPRHTPLAARRSPLATPLRSSRSCLPLRRSAGGARPRPEHAVGPDAARPCGQGAADLALGQPPAQRRAARVRRGGRVRLCPNNTIACVLLPYDHTPREVPMSCWPLLRRCSMCHVCD